MRVVGERMQVEEDFVDVTGGRVFVCRWIPHGTAGVAPVVLLHDSLGCVDLWRGFPAALAERLERPVIAYDRLGFGRSSARAGLPSPAFIREEADTGFPEVARALGLDRFALFGHSVGGVMALFIAASQSSACERVVTEAAQAFVEQRTVEGIRAARDNFRDPGQFARLVRWHGDKAGWVLEAWTQTWLSPAFADWRLDDHLGPLECPVLVVHGDRDEYGSLAFPERIVACAGPRARQAILEDCGHVPHREQPERLLRAVAGFFADPDAERSSVG